jgi:hypothetical protein
MKLVLGIGFGYYPYTQKPADYQPYRPIYLFRGPPPDAGFSYGLYEDEEAQKLYYADLGLESFSPFSGKPAKLVREVDDRELSKNLENHKEFEDVQCPYCGGKYKQNIKTELKGRDNLYCHRCGGKL